MRRAAVLHDGRDHPHPVRIRHRASLPVGKSVGLRAHGDRGDRRLRPRPDGARLRHRSAVPAALQADRVGRAGRRGDPVLPVGPRAEGRPRHPLGRRMHPPGQGGHDDPHRRAGGALPARRQEAVRRADDEIRQVGGPGHRTRVRRRQAQRARGTPPPRRPVALPGRAERQGRQGRLARPAHAVLDRQIRLPHPRRRGDDRPRRVRRGRGQAVPPLRGLPVVGPLQHAFPHRPRRGAAVVRHPARGRGPARLHRASGHAGRRALHEALLPDRQGRRRSHRDRLLGARGSADQAGAGADAG